MPWNWVRYLGLWQTSRQPIPILHTLCPSQDTWRCHSFWLGAMLGAGEPPTKSGGAIQQHCPAAILTYPDRRFSQSILDLISCLLTKGSCTNLLKLVKGEALACLGSLCVDAAVLRVQDEHIAVLALGWTLQTAVGHQTSCEHANMTLGPAGKLVTRWRSEHGDISTAYTLPNPQR